MLVASNVGSGSFQWREEQTFPAGTEAHYYLRILMSNNANLWTGPVYVTYDPNFQTAVAGPVGGAIALAVGPNPSHGRSVATFALPQAESHATLADYDAAGRHVATLLDGPLAAGVHQVAWSGGDDLGRSSPAGIYFLRLSTSRQTAVRKLLVLR